MKAPKSERKKRKKVGSREKTMTNGNGNPNLKWERQPTAAGVHIWQKTFHMVSAFMVTWV